MMPLSDTALRRRPGIGRMMVAVIRAEVDAASRSSRTREPAVIETAGEAGDHRIAALER